MARCDGRLKDRGRCTRRVSSKGRCWQHPRKPRTPVELDVMPRLPAHSLPLTALERYAEAFDAMSRDVGELYPASDFVAWIKPEVLQRRAG